MRGQHLDVLEELDESLLDVAFLRQLLDIEVGGVLEAPEEQRELSGLLGVEGRLVEQLDEEVGSVEGLSEGLKGLRRCLLEGLVQVGDEREFVREGQEHIGAVGQMELELGLYQ